MIDYGKHNVLGIMIDAVDYESAVNSIIDAAHGRRSYGVSALAVHGVMTGVLDSSHAHRLNSLDLITPDGQPVRWALRLLHDIALPDRVYGPNLTLKVCERAATEGLPIYFYGSRTEVLEKLIANLQSKFPLLQIAGYQPSRFRQVPSAEKLEIASAIHNSGAAITFVGLGCPRQEVWVYEYLELLSMPLMAVGAAFDFHAGLLPQAPVLLQNNGLEWLYRLWQEPARLWRRYLHLNPHYAYLVALQMFGLKKFEPSKASPPQHELSYG